MPFHYMNVRKRVFDTFNPILWDVLSGLALHQAIGRWFEEFFPMI